MQTQFDTIVAPITAPGGAVGIVRVSGPDSFEIAARFAPSLPSSPTARYAYFGSFATGDEGLTILFEEGRSFTGDASAEFHLHGSSASMDAAVNQLIGFGARMARPGEFTERAFLNGKMELTQAEAVNDTVRSSTARQLELANHQRRGDLKMLIADAENGIIKVMATIEANVDFSEELGPLDVPELVSLLHVARARLGELIEFARRGSIVRTGVRVVIAGPPNAGKSSLLNRLLGDQRAIVSPIAGTTRDYIEHTLSVSGVPVTFVDTAGLRETADEVESIGIDLAGEQIAKASLVWYLADGSRPLGAEDISQIEKLGEKAWLLATKSDLGVARFDGIPVSTMSGDGIDGLLERLAESFGDLDTLSVVPNARHLEHLQLTDARLGDAISGLTHDLPPDLVVTHLRAAIHELGLITGAQTSPDILTRIFADFCIGK